MGTICTKKTIRFPSLKRLQVEAEFSGGNVSTNGGILLLQQADELLGLTKSISAVLEDPRREKSCQHSLLEMLRQRVYSLATGYEDLNDHDTLRHDLALQTAVGSHGALSSAPTLCRFENRADRRVAYAIEQKLLEQFIKSFKTAPPEIILDFDATDDPVHGNQEGRFFHTYYGGYCFLPLYVVCGNQVLVSYLRRSNRDGAKHAGPILRWLTREIRRKWPKVKIIFRADSGFCRHTIFHWCERNNVKYIVGIAKNARLLTQLAPLLAEAEQRFAKEEKKQRLFTEFRYAADTWKQKRRVIGKAEYSAHGENPRFIITNLRGDPQLLYDQVYCARGDMENRIKQQQEMFSDRTSCHDWWPNQFRLLLSTLAYTLVNAIREIALQGTELARAQVGTIRLKLLRIGAVVLKNTRRVRFLLSSSWPYQDLFFIAASRLRSP